MPTDSADPFKVQAPRSDDAVLSMRLSLFCLRAAEVFDSVLAGRILMVDAADMLHDASVSSGLADAVGHDAVQKMLCAAFANASASRDKQQEPKQ